jgi:hypothetical protein
MTGIHHSTQKISRLRLQALVVAVLVALAVFLVQPAAANADARPVSDGAFASVRSTQAIAVEASVQPLCCASAWYPWSWHFTKADCNAAGKKVLHDVPLALAYKCLYVANPPASTGGRHYHLYILEAT